MTWVLDKKLFFSFYNLLIMNKVIRFLQIFFSDSTKILFKTS